ncbi:MAG: hypothetical protein BAA04_09680 [Firmicutes bacterium ZCTH02-B6]|nr:MAG: hypothetical protein BAA04_09680 [Firmicutes bacterium ZCTH02-B6]
MAGRGPAPKPAHLRQRRNKKAGATTLTPPPEGERRRPPTLPNPDGRKWHRLTRAWWRRVWASPMASEYLETDVDGLGRLAVLVDDFHKAESAKERKELLQEIRLQEARFGLSPVDRSRLQWEIAKGDEASRRRQPPRPVEEPQEPARDPRAVLRVVK